MLSKITPGEHIPDQINVIIEIPANSEPIKYEVDKHTGALFVDRFMTTSMHYPCDYGYVPQTLCDDGDPVDVLILSPLPLLPGCIIQARPIGMLKMTDESGIDAKILAVPLNKLTPLYSNIHDITDIMPVTLKKIEHFFAHYKDLEDGKWVKIDGWGNIDNAKQEILKAIALYQSTIS